MEEEIPAGGPRRRVGSRRFRGPSSRARRGIPGTDCGAKSHPACEKTDRPGLREYSFVYVNIYVYIYIYIYIINIYIIYIYIYIYIYIHIYIYI